MLLSIAAIVILGLLTGTICKKLHLPSLIGMLATGIILGPSVLGFLDDKILSISPEIRTIALIIILTRAGLGLDISGLKRIGRPAVMMCFVPATLEIIGFLLLGPSLLGLTLLEAAILGAVIAAVSPAVVVPRMVKLTEDGYGTKQGIPQLILAGASVDDVYVIVLFTTFTGIATGGDVSVMKFVNIPISIVLGIAIGIGVGYILSIIFRSFHMRDTVKVLAILCISFILVAAEDMLNTPITFAALIAIMFIGVGLQRFRPIVVPRLSAKFNKLWVGAELFLFVLVGAAVKIDYLKNIGLMAVIMIFCALIFRMLGVFICMLGTKLSGKERLFAMLAYTPKATVQAAIGGKPLLMGLACGDIVLSVAVLAIVITAPLGAFAIDNTYKLFLSKENK